jgi:hypothetical protein
MILVQLRRGVDQIPHFSAASGWGHQETIDATRWLPKGVLLKFRKPSFW